MIPVLYIEETRDDNTKDWHFCVRYLGDDNYLVYGYRFNYGKDFYMKSVFGSRLALSDFLRSSCCCDSSKMDITLYFVDENDILLDHFDSYYSLYTPNNEIYGYDDATFTHEAVMKHLRILRDMRIL
jgi:hypothetical protein